MTEKKPSVLIVDDDHECRLMLSTVFAHEGYAVNAVADGAMALAIMRSQPPDLVMLDAQLPRINGFDVCRQIKSNELTARIPVVILTGFSIDSAREQSLEAGADQFVEKPFSADVLLAVVRQVLRAPQLQTREGGAL
jgi:DNA-binding response OmpR family regulator